MRRTRIVLCLAGFLAIEATAVFADTVTLQAAKDNTLYQDPNGFLSNGAGPAFFAGTTSSRQAIRRRVNLCAG